MTLISSTRCQLKRLLRTAAPVFSSPSFSTVPTVEAFKTLKNDPEKHTIEDEGLFYSINNSVSLNVLFKERKGLPSDFFEECITFEETPIMVRKPALEIINYLNNTDYEKPINKYVLYGKFGSGVTTTLAHIIHYAYNLGWLLVHVPRVEDFGYLKTEVYESPSRPGFLDVPTLGSAWLSHFKNQNLNIINKLDLKLENDYKWNIQEQNKAGDSLINLVNHGIVRTKYSCDVIIALLDEIKNLSRSGKVKTLVALDGFSTIFHPAGKSPHPKITYYSPAKISCIPAFKNMAKADWHNGAVVLTCVSTEGSLEVDNYPLNKLTREGFEFLDPFVPIEVPEFSKKEMMSVLAYYKSKNWLRDSKGDRELMFLSGGNGLFLRNLCGPV